MTVLIIADDAEFGRDVVGRWKSERNMPTFTLVSSVVWQGAAGGFDLAVLGPMPAEHLPPVLRMLETSSSAPVLCVASEDGVVQQIRVQFSRVMVLRQHEGWLDTVVLLGAEVLRRVEANVRARAAEESAALAQRYATLGRYMLEMRHSFNNALTSVLGHAELLLLEPGTFSPEIRDQIKIIHSMTMRLHEILQRFSSLDAEMLCAERESHSDTGVRAWGSGAAS